MLRGATCILVPVRFELGKAEFWVFLLPPARNHIFGRASIENGDDGGMPIFDENQESWVTLANQLMIGLFGVTSSLALVCVMREGIQKIRGPTTYNVNLFRKAIRDTLQRKLHD